MATGLRTRLGEILLDARVVTEDQLRHATEIRRDAEGKKPRLEAIIVEQGYATEETVARTLARALHVPYIDLATVDIDPELIQTIPQWLAERHRLVPVRRTAEGVMVAMTDPTNLVAIDDIRVSAHVGKVTVGVAPQSAVLEMTDRIYSVELAATEILDRLGAAVDVEVLPDEDEGDEEAHSDDEEMVPIISLTNALLADAVRGRASDVHIEPRPADVEVRYRVDGVLREVMSLPKHIQGLVVSRLKIMAGMDIAERRRPQDGRTRVLVDRREVDARVSTSPTISGEKVFLRLLYETDEKSSLASLGLEAEQLETLQQHLMLSQGLLIFTGPTGSGKTSTMYAGLSQMPGTEKSMVTLEDPIEHQIPGVTQVQVDEEVGVTFARGLRSFLRQDPDVIMVGEIRDLETAQMALQASLTGHLVLSSVHTNDAPSAITRLEDLGVDPFLIASALSLVVAQRLVRVICPHCKTDGETSERTLKLLGLTEADLADIEIQRGRGCQECAYTGYLGRTGIYEILPITSHLREQIGAQVSEGVLTETVRAADVGSLREAGLKKVRDGITTLEEVLRATYVEQEEVRRCPGCRHEVEASYVVCAYCQTDLTVDSCPSCGRDTGPDWRWCPYCRADLPGKQEGLSLDRRRLLIVDDDPSIREMTATMFEDDYEVLVAGTGEEAIRRATLERPDVILLDLRLPDVASAEVTKRLRGNALTSLIPVIMITGEEGPELESLRSGVDDQIQKPFDEESLRARLELVLSRASRSARSPFMALRDPAAEPGTEAAPPAFAQPDMNQKRNRKTTKAKTTTPPKTAAAPQIAPKVVENPQGSANGSEPAAAIEFKIPEEALVSVAIYNERGVLVRRLVSSELLPPGKHSLTWDGRNNAKRPAEKGTYSYQVKAETLNGHDAVTLSGTTTLGN